ncbi:hypothetical protein NIES2101_41750 [Calothrix sp. HK-06]|nr:hypothetical protein NIES2101_41750 [Calothrix sp. HK-06]
MPERRKTRPKNSELFQEFIASLDCYQDCLSHYYRYRQLSVIMQEQSVNNITYSSNLFRAALQAYISATTAYKNAIAVHRDLTQQVLMDFVKGSQD